MVAGASGVGDPKAAAPAMGRAPASASDPKALGMGAGRVRLAVGGLAPVTAARVRRFVEVRTGGKGIWVSPLRVPLLGPLFHGAMGASGSLGTGFRGVMAPLENRVAGVPQDRGVALVPEKTELMGAVKVGRDTPGRGQNGRVRDGNGHSGARREPIAKGVASGGDPGGRPPLGGGV